MVSKALARDRYRTRQCGSPTSCCCCTGNNQHNYAQRYYNGKAIIFSGNNNDQNWSKKGKTKYDPTAKRPNRLCDPYGQGGQPLSYEAATKLRTTLHTDWIFHMPPTIEKVDTSIPTVQNPMTNSAANNQDTVHIDKTTPLTTNHDAKAFPTDSDSATNSKNTLSFPMYTASEEVQRAFASLPPTPPTTTTSSSSASLISSEQESTVTPTNTWNSPNNNNNTNNVTFSRYQQQQPNQEGTAPSSRQQQQQQQQQLPSPLALIRTFQHPDFMSGSRFVQNIAAVAQLTAHYPTLTLERKIIHRHWYIISTIQCHTLVLGGLSSFDFHLATVRAYNMFYVTIFIHNSLLAHYVALTCHLCFVSTFIKMIDIEVERPEVQQNLLK